MHRPIACLLGVSFFCLSAATAVVAQQEEGQKTESASSPLVKELAPLVPYLGDWEIDAKWSSGEALWARNEYRPTMKGRFVEVKTFAKDGDGEPYHRYTTIYGYDAKAEKIMAHGFTYDGSTSQIPVAVESFEGDDQAISSSWKPDPSADAEIRQIVWTKNDGAYGWNVYMRSSPEADYQSVMEGTWKRVPATATAK